MTMKPDRSQQVARNAVMNLRLPSETVAILTEVARFAGMEAGDVVNVMIGFELLRHRH